MQNCHKSPSKLLNCQIFTTVFVEDCFNIWWFIVLLVAVSLGQRDGGSNLSLRAFHLCIMYFCLFVLLSFCSFVLLSFCLFVFLAFCLLYFLSFYRTQVNLGSDLWVRLVSHKGFWNLTDVILADEDKKSILADNAIRAINPKQCCNACD